MIGREDLQPIEEERDELVIEPQIDAIKKRKPMYVDMAKQQGREEHKHLDDDEFYLPGEVE